MGDLSRLVGWGESALISSFVLSRNHFETSTLSWQKKRERTETSDGNFFFFFFGKDKISLS